MATLLAFYNLTKSFGSDLVLDAISYQMKEQDKVALIGVNGSGKTTLFSLITGALEPDSGDIYLQRGIKIGHMQQHATFDANRSVYLETLSVFQDLLTLEEQLLRVQQELQKEDADHLALSKRQQEYLETYQSLGGLTYESKTKSMLLGMGFSQAEIETPMHTLSGGQQSKIQMAKLLLSKPDLLLLDEPTNHLDIPSVEWLEDFLLDYAGAYLVISHDRYFLDRVTKKTMEIEHCKLLSFDAPYSKYMEIKEKEAEVLAHQFKSAQREIKRKEESIAQLRRWNREKSIRRARSMEKQLERFKETVVTPEKDPPAITFDLDAIHRGGNDVIVAEGLSKSFGDKQLFENVSFHITRGERVFLIGPNGCGKTTLLNMLQEKESLSSGTISLGTGVQIGYYDQHQSDLDHNLTVLDAIVQGASHVNVQQARNALAPFLFRGDDVFQKIGTLSGGERARVELLQLVMSQSNFLLLDEPTNHLDAASSNSLEQALLEYPGTILAVSHDRFLINKLATRIFVLHPHGIQEYVGNYDDYLAKSKEEKAQLKKTATPQKEHSTKSLYAKRKVQSSQLRKQRALVRDLENDILNLETELATCTELLADEALASDYEKLHKLSEKSSLVKKKLDTTLSTWAKESEALAEMEE